MLEHLIYHIASITPISVNSAPNSRAYIYLGIDGSGAMPGCTSEFVLIVSF
jgi:hypothetical protein